MLGQPCCSHLQPCLGNTSALNQERCPARKRPWCSVQRSLGCPVITIVQRQTEHAPHPSTDGAEIRLSSGLLVGMSPGHPSHMWGQSESSRAKPGLAQLSQFLTPADSTDKTSALTFLNVQGYGLEVTSIWSKPCPRQGHHRS